MHALTKPLLLLGCALLTSGAIAADLAKEKKAAAEETLELPKLEVSAEFPTAGWIYGSAAEVEFLSQLSVAKTKRIVRDFVIFQDFVRTFFPEAALPVQHPITIILCKTSEEHRMFAGASKEERRVTRASDRYCIVNTGSLDPLWIARGLRTWWMEAGYSFRTNTAYPLWVEMGTKEILAAVDIGDDGRVNFGYPPFQPHSRRVVIPSAVVAPVSPQFGLQQGDEIPLVQLFTIARDTALPPDLRRTYVAEATAFMHQCLFSTHHRKFRSGFQKFVERLRVAPYSPELFQDCFGEIPGDMDSYLHDYLFGKEIKHETRRYKVSEVPSIDCEVAKPAAVLRLLRDCERLRSARN